MFDEAGATLRRGGGVRRRHHGQEDARRVRRAVRTGVKCCPINLFFFNLKSARVCVRVCKKAARARVFMIVV